jgi:hypothetical protein
MNPDSFRQTDSCDAVNLALGPLREDLQAGRGKG